MNIKERNQDKWLLWTVVLLVIFGLSILFSASWIKSLEITEGAVSYTHLTLPTKRIV